MKSLVALLFVIFPTLSHSQTLIGSVTINYRFNTAGCPDSQANAYNPYQCPGLIPPGPVLFDNLAAGDYQIVVTAVGSLGSPGVVIWTGDPALASSSNTGYTWQFATNPQIIGSTTSFSTTAQGTIAFFAHDWFPNDNDSGYSSTFSLYSLSALSTPIKLQANQLGLSGTQIQLTWDYGTDLIDGFELDRQTPSQLASGIWPSPSTLVSTSNCTQTATGFSCTYIDSVPIAYATYNYQVRAYKGTVESSNSNQDAAFQLQLQTLRNNVQMLATFQPDVATLSEAAGAFGFDHFNWMSLMTYAPSSVTLSPRFKDIYGNTLNPPPPPIIDPPLGGWSYLPADTLPYFWNEQSGFDSRYFLGQHMTPLLDSTLLDFNDLPVLPLTAWGDHYEFETFLVGVKTSIGSPQFEELASFSWSSNFTGVSNGITDFKIFNLDPPITVGPGGIFNVQHVPTAALPLAVRNALLSAGAQGVSTAPKVDKDAPSTAIFLSGKQGTSGWYTGPVTVTLIATDIDGPSDIAYTSYSIDGGSKMSYSTPFNVSADGLHTILFNSADQSGNTEALRSSAIKLDQTPPSIIASRSPASNGKRWNSTPVTVSFNCADTLSGLASGSPPAPTTLSAQMSGQSVHGLCGDLAGNTSTLTVGGINIDETAPTIRVTTPANGATYSTNKLVNAAYACSDTLSGIATCAGTASSGSKMDTAPAGTLTKKTFMVNATDVAGNSNSQVVDYSVSCHYVSQGLSPSTVARGGSVTVTGTVMSCQSNSQTVSVKFTLTGPLGPKSCTNSSAVMFTSPQFSIPAGTSKTLSFPVIIPKTSCAGLFTLVSTTVVAGVPVDSTSATLTVK